MGLMALGMFVFDADTLLYDAMERQRAWRHGRTERFRARAASQFLGPGDDKITISGTLVQELVGQYSAITTLAHMADAGEAYLLMRGDGMIFGKYTIDSMTERHSAIFINGAPRVVGFSLELTRVS